MALPKIDSPVYELTFPLSKKTIKYRPFLVKEQKNLMMAIEANDSETIQRNIKQVLHNCTLTENVDIEKLPVVDIEYYFLQLRARSVGEIVESRYICNNMVGDTECGNLMEVKMNILEVGLDKQPTNDVIQLTDTVSMKLSYPKYSTIEKMESKDTSVDIAFELVVNSIEYIFDGQQYYYAEESSYKELMEFIETLNAEQFEKIENFFKDLPKLNKKIDMVCSKCGYVHNINVEGLENFFD